MTIKVVGRWRDGKAITCGACVELKKLARAALEELGFKEVAVESCASEEEYASYGVVATPILIINGKIKSSGKVPPKEMLKALLKFESEEKI